MGRDIRGLSSDYIIEEENSMPTVQIFHKMYVLELFLNKIKKMESNKIY